ncbi:MAG: nucleotidyltransferase domain-containing protein [Nanoarchaeota archaeon]|nr:nucleotidyltransferase domain-containing protein [DPANN group archaeon]MBL7117077.1 nucleotidyltransferase domain-containing protein [Nanoarchaeota archaeon]
MAKKKNKKKSSLENLPKDIPDETKKKLVAIKSKLDKFKTKILSKFEDYVMGIALLPPAKEEENKDKINVLVLVDDSDSQKMPKGELKDKLLAIMKKMAEELDKNLSPEVVILTELWQSCYDGKYELLQMIALAAPVYDKGMLAAIKIAEVHKTMVLKKFEKYIVSYVLAGSLVQGKATPQSDIDVFIVIDDTDVKKMTRAELKDKLRAIIIGMGLDAGKMTGIENKLNIQVYILTDFWENVKEANPIIFTFLRDGVPFYDRGIFMPWKQLLQMGRVKPSPEAIDMFKSTGDQMIQRIKFKLRDIGMEDLFYATLTPSQAAIMLFGIPPPTPKETPNVLMDVFVKKEKLLEKEYVDILQSIIDLRKDLEHGTKKEVAGADIDKLLAKAEKYLKRLNKLFKQIEKVKEQDTVVHNYEGVITIIRDILRLEGVERVKDSEVIKIFESEVINKGLIPEKYLRILKQIVKAKKEYDAKKLLKHDVAKLNKDVRELIKFLVEYIQRKRGRELEKTRIRVKHGKKFGEVILLGKQAFIIHDIDNEDKDISSAKINDDGSISDIKKSSLEELEKALTAVEIPPKVFIKEPIFENLKGIFGRDVEVLINY